MPRVSTWRRLTEWLAAGAGRERTVEITCSGFGQHDVRLGIDGTEVADGMGETAEQAVKAALAMSETEGL